MPASPVGTGWDGVFVVPILKDVSSISTFTFYNKKVPVMVAVYSGVKIFLKVVA